MAEKKILAEALCIFCENLCYNRAYSYHGTMGALIRVEGGLTCKEGHFKKAKPRTVKSYRTLVLKGVACKDHTLKKV